METKTFDWLNREEYPFTSKFHRIGKFQQHYIDEGKGEVLLFVHGTPSWSFDFRNVIKQLQQTHRCIALDHIGFGLSDKPADYAYTLQNHERNLEGLVNALSLQNITLVLHDFGGPIGLEFALKNPDKVKRLILLNTCTGNSEDLPEFKKMKRILKSPLLPFLYLRLNFSARFLLPGSFGEKKLQSSLKKQFTSPFPNRDSRHGTLGFAQSLLNDQVFFQSQFERLGQLRNKSTLLLWGMKDKFVLPLYRDRFKSCFDNVESIELKTAGHFPQEEDPGAVTTAIQNFMTKS